MRARRLPLRRLALAAATAALLLAVLAGRPGAARTPKPVLHARHWLAITGKPLAATAGAMTFQKEGMAPTAARALRHSARLLSRVFTPLPVLEGFWDLTIVLECATNCRIDPCSGGLPGQWR